MPKTPKRKNRTDSQASSTGATAHPYQRIKEEAKAPAPPPSSASTHPKMPNPAAPSSAKSDGTRKEKRERRRRERASVGGGEEAAPAPAPATAPAAPAHSAPSSQEERTKKVKKAKMSSVEAVGDIYARLASGGSVAASQAPTSSPAKPSTDDAYARAHPYAHPNNAKDKRMRQEIRDLEAKVQKAEGIVMQTQQEMAAKLAELGNQLREKEAALAANQAALDDKTRELDAQKDELNTKTTLLSDRDRHADALRETLACTVCFETLDDPHVLTCGHAACKRCLLQWFRSPNAYRGSDIEDVQPDTKLTYRTKLCHLCRAPVFTRPIRMFVMQHVLEAVGFVDSVGPTNSPDLITADDNPWKNIFPPDPVSYAIPDEDDGVNRCPGCGHEIAEGECSQCNERFSRHGSESDFDSDDDSLGSVMDGSDLDDDDALLEAAAQVLGQTGAPGGDAAAPGVAAARALAADREWSPATLANWEAQMRIAGALAVHTDTDGSDSESVTDDDGSDDDGSESSFGTNASSQHGHGTYCECNACMDESDDDEPVAAAPPASRGRSRRYDTPNSVLADSDGDEYYEASFIDDSEGEHDEIGDSEDEVDDVAEPDEPTIDELRARRANRYAANDAPVAPAAAAAAPITNSRRRRARVIDISDDDE
ncbi:putative RING finger protein [Vanrija pseudolonga]|uniref:Purtative RING finger protein n=1 Tax=Vanrija pseudolonga TaxID=143232 RepID=A0AAF0YDR9_9TREE|nr:purtative RING finger protein [Vanrija pseudolonga]